ncbi:hypothetical protein KL86DYS2_10453 [uncultured Dysgonomonas sp.]|uniref:Replication-associated protein G2P N-terminal domain-containing protein n=1 Tax=uncultured Dysgonomonas sp. TaxID=206096 RepID=A0A212J0F8_9BACT|nr:phage/plasmid replication protein [uncultured Dysgonomonas sp.]SBV92936.1 hypothetical protein KL86DYS2_10453 [uncultured Dysgonomonas sp.]
MFDNTKARCNSYYIPEFKIDKLIEKKGVFEKTRGQNYFKLFNPDNLTRNYLKITPPRDEDDYPTLKIEGSIRKWYLGNTIDDLSKFEYKDAWEQVFSLLEIPSSKMQYFNIVRAEIGLNVAVKRPCHEIEKAILGYKSNCYVDKSTKGEGRKFKSNSFSIKLYNKIEEIIAPFKNKRIKTNEEKAILKEYENKNILRIEFTISGGKSKIEEKLGYCTLADSITYFDSSYLFFWDSLLRLEFDKNWGDNLIFNPEGKQLRELIKYLTIEGIRKNSLDTIKQWAKKMKHGRNVVYSIKNLLKDNSIENNSYGEKGFYKDVKIQMIYSMQKSRCIIGNVKKLVRTKVAA